jgi:hypothetical protein
MEARDSARAKTEEARRAGLFSIHSARSGAGAIPAQGRVALQSVWTSNGSAIFRLLLLFTSTALTAL